jgi:hypothetical protein
VDATAIPVTPAIERHRRDPLADPGQDRIDIADIACDDVAGLYTLRANPLDFPVDEHACLEVRT